MSSKPNTQRDGARRMARSGASLRKRPDKTNAKLSRKDHAHSQQQGAGRKSRPAVPRTLLLLEAMASEDNALQLQGISARVGLPKATASRLCHRLRTEGYLFRDPRGRYSPGPRLLRLGFGLVRSGGPGQRRREVLRSLVADVGETCNFTIQEDDKVLYLDRVETKWPLRLHLEPGSRVPMHCTASGKLLLASLPPSRCTRLLDSLELTAETAHTITSRRMLEAELDRIRRQRYSTDNEEFLLGLIAVAVPVRDARGETIAAVACHAPVARLSLKAAIALRTRLRQAALELSETMTA